VLEIMSFAPRHAAAWTGSRQGRQGAKEEKEASSLFLLTLAPLEPRRFMPLPRAALNEVAWRQARLPGWAL